MVVVDASAIVDGLLHPGIFHKLATIPEAEDWIAAPVFVNVEVISALRRLEIHRRITARRAVAAVADFRQLPLVTFDVAGLIPVIWRLRHDFSVFDAAYLVLAWSLAAALVTRDARLAAKAAGFAEIILL